MSELQQRLSSRAFALLCLSVFLAYSHQAFLTPTVPLYVTDLGGSTLMAGLVLLSFSIPSFTFRPLVGYWTDTWNVFGVLIIGTLLLATGAILHLPRVLGLLFLAGAVRGLGWAGLNTGGFSLLAHIAPSARRGEAASYYNISTASPNTLFPALAIFLLDVPHAGFVAVFLLSAGTALLATLTGASIPREKILSEQRQIKSQKLSLSLLLEPSILLPT
ncbi:MAG TPA: MFS transporter, partial [Dehalococcoidia bacterium]|nr:MFS transporter [Dehalococcoidia bacterium]